MIDWWNNSENKFWFKSLHEMFIVEHRQWVYGSSAFCMFENVYSQMLRRHKKISEEVAKKRGRRSSLKNVFTSQNISIPGPPSWQPWLCPWLCVPDCGFQLGCRGNLVALFLAPHRPLLPLFWPRGGTEGLPRMQVFPAQTREVLGTWEDWLPSMGVVIDNNDGFRIRLIKVRSWLTLAFGPLTPIPLF